jgi:cytochrome c peroxidase
MNTVRTIIAVAALSMVAVAVRASGVTTIDQVGQQFSEKSVKLAVGDTIQFANKDDVTHNINVVNDDDDDTDLGLQKPGQTLTYKFDKAGKFKIRCGIHPNMKMTVSVQ